MFPWQKKQWQQLWRSEEADRLAHALLFAGSAGIGKTQFAHHFIKALLCQHRKMADNSACEHCHTCRLMKGRAHPDVLCIEPEKEGQAIKVDQIRELSEFVYQSALKGNKRIVVITPADALNANAANALLKTLEEPALGTYIILISHQAQSLPATVLSRCQRILFPLPNKTEVLPWLKKALPNETDIELLLRLANGAPLTAVQCLQDDHLILRKTLFAALLLLSQKKESPLQLAASLQQAQPLKLIDFMLTWMMDLIRLQVGCEDIINQDYLKSLLTLTHVHFLQQQASFMVYLQQLRVQLIQGIHLNKQLLLESMLIRWMECC
ncbi:MAG: DNA polymerase III subunit delta' [Gammaproteobacteria bacterium]|nr:DNA polymerase III subunit delta' [Gammaproteobacteria bacterium]